MLAGQRQWIATTNCAGCSGQPPDSFANSAVLTTSAKVPDALGWPTAPCFPVQIDPKAEQFEQVVARADQRPFGSPSPVPAAGRNPRPCLIWPNTGSTVCIRKASAADPAWL